MKSYYKKKLYNQQKEIDKLKYEINILKKGKFSNLKPREKQISDSDIKYIKELREDGYTYREISLKTKWSKATISRVINGLYD